MTSKRSISLDSKQKSISSFFSKVPKYSSQTNTSPTKEPTKSDACDDASDTPNITLVASSTPIDKADDFPTSSNQACDKLVSSSDTTALGHRQVHSKLTLTHPNQPEDGEFPRNDSHRCYQPRWAKDFKWITYDTANDS